jgi:two-component system CheB/CheR fusion protein
MSAETPKEFDALLHLLKTERGFDFTGYKRASLVRRVRRRMQTVGVDDYAEYMRQLARDPDEFDHLFNTILINVTTFFRDGVPWDFLSQEIIPRIVAHKQDGAAIRIWSAGCASGQEAYTLAMMVADSIGAEDFLRRVKIYATDLDDDALAYARQGLYSPKEVNSLPEELLERYFDRQDGVYAFRKNLRRCVIFGRNDLVDDAPISKIDLLVCRNTLMYFDAQTQARIINRFHFALRDGGFLFLGKAETLTAHSSLFEPVDLQRRVFAKLSTNRLGLKLGIRDVDPAPLLDGDGERETVSAAVFEKSPIGQFVIDKRGNLALINERARHLFRLNNADIGRPLQDLEVSYRPVELRSLLDQIHEEGRAIRIPEVSWATAGEQQRWFEVHLIPLFNADHAQVAVTVGFEDITAVRDLKLALQRTHTDLETAYEELQSSNEELETTNEELQSTVEELETTNEELHSTNEELETMNEELQSTNEELAMSNDELRKRGTQLGDLNRFLRSIFASLRGGVVVIDSQLRVKVWNHRAEDLWGLRAEEVVDKRFTDLDIGLPVSEVRPLIQETLRDGSTSKETIFSATNRRGRGINCRVTSTPLVGPDHQAVQGAILTMEELPAK